MWPPKPSRGRLHIHGSLVMENRKRGMQFWPGLGSLILSPFRHPPFLMEQERAHKDVAKRELRRGLNRSQRNSRSGHPSAAS